MRKIILILLCSVLVSTASAQSVEEKVVNKLMPFILKELEGTDAKKDIDNFYKTPAFKALGMQPYSIKYKREDNNLVYAQWKHRDEKVMEFMHRAVEIQAKFLNIKPEDFLKNNDYMRRLAVCAAPIFVHETMHQKETADMLAMGFATTINPRSEVLGYGHQFLFMVQKQIKYPKNPEKYYIDCDSLMDYILNLGLTKDFAGFQNELVKQLNAMQSFPMPQLDLPNVKAALYEYQRTYGNDDARTEALRGNEYKKLLEAHRLNQPVFIKIDDFIIKGRYDWRRAPIQDLRLAASGKHINFNKYNAWYDKELKSLSERMKIARDLFYLKTDLNKALQK